MDATLYGKLIESLSANGEWGVVTEMLGKDTEFEAIYMVTCDDETAMWDGYLVFKDHRFSPSEGHEDGLPYGALQFKHFPPGAANGVLAAQRAQEYWKTLCQIFTGLMPKKIAALSPEHMALDIDDVLMLREHGVPERDIEGLNRYVETIVDERNYFMTGKPIDLKLDDLPKYES